METLISAEMIKALSEGDFPRFAAYVAIFVFIWIEVRGLKKEVAKLNGTIALKFEEGQTRFTEIEHRLTVIEKQLPQGG